MRKASVNIEVQLLNEACSIAEALIAQLHCDDKGCCWHTLHYDVETNTATQKLSINILNGAPGIVLFMLELYQHTGTSRYLHVAKAAMQRLFVDPVSDSPEYFTLYSGATGLIYTATKIYDTCGDHAFLEMALALAKQYDKDLRTRVKKKDLLSGDAGNLLALTYLYHFAEDESVFELILFLINRLVNSACPAVKGIRWLEGTLSFDALTGFSHGSSGIAYVLLQVGNYFGNSDLVWLAEQALLYEMNYFSKEKNNWEDLRLLTSWLTGPGTFEWNISKFKSITNDINAWAHGAAGIGIARLYAFHITGKKKYLKQIGIIERRSLNDFKHKQWINYSLLTGFGGIAEFLLSAFNRSRNKQLLNTAQLIALKAIDYNKAGHLHRGTLGKDPGLFSGLAGIGYLLLRTINGGRSGSILQPWLPIRCIGSITTSYKQQYFSTYYRRTIALLHHLQPGTVIPYQAESLGNFRSALKKLISILPGIAVKRYIADVFKLEIVLAERWMAHKGRQCFVTRIELLRERNKCLQQAPVAVFKKKKFLCTPFVALHCSRYAWAGWNENMAELPLHHSPPGHWQLLFSNEYGVELQSLNAFAAFILQQLSTPSSVLEIVESMEITGMNKEDLTNRVVEQLREMLTGFLIMETSFH